MVEDAAAAYQASVAAGGVGVLPPTTLQDKASGTTQVIAEVKLYGDVVLRYVSGSFQVREFVQAWRLGTLCKHMCMSVFARVFMWI